MSCPKPSTASRASPRIWWTARRPRVLVRAVRPSSSSTNWARVGRAVSNQHTASRRRVEAALAGHLPMTDLTLEEGVVFNAEISAAIEERLSRTNYGDVLAAQGITTVALNDAGDIVEHRPDGTSVVLAATP